MRGKSVVVTSRGNESTRLTRRQIYMNEIKHAEIRGVRNKLFDGVNATDRRESDVEYGGSFMVDIPKTISKLNVEQQLEYMKEVRS